CCIGGISLASDDDDFSTGLDLIASDLNSGFPRLLGDTEERRLTRAALFVRRHFSQPGIADDGAVAGRCGGRGFGFSRASSQRAARSRLNHSRSSARLTEPLRRTAVWRPTRHQLIFVITRPPIVMIRP